IAIGTAIANRNRNELEGLIGCFVNTLVMRLDVAAEARLPEVVRSAREAALGAYAHQDVPFEKVVEEMHPDRDSARSPLFRVMLVLQNGAEEQLKLGALRLSGYGPEAVAVKHDLAVQVGHVRGELCGQIIYRADMYDQVDIERLAGHFKRVLEVLVGGGDE